MSVKHEALLATALSSPAPILVFDGEKGGVGKSMLARAVAFLVTLMSRLWRGFDLDPRNGTFERFHPDQVDRINWLEPSAWDDLYLHIIQTDPHSVILIDLPAQVGSAWANQAARLEATARHLKRPVIRLWTMSAGFDSVNQLHHSFHTVCPAQTIAVLNLHHAEERAFTTWKESNTRARLLQGGGLELRLPTLSAGVAKLLDDQNISFVAARSSVDLPFYLYDIEAFLAEVERQFAPLLERLV